MIDQTNHRALIILGVLAAASSASGQACEQQKLDAASGSQLYGDAVDIWGDLAVVGASDDSFAAWSAGATFVYRFDGESWVHEDKLFASVSLTQAYMGRGVAVSPNEIAAGVPFPPNSGQHGYVNIFTRIGDGSWTETATLAANDGEPGSQFGWAVDKTNGLVLVGAPRHDTGPWQGGRAHLFRFDGTGWVEEADFPPVPTELEDDFGHAVALTTSGHVVVVGAPRTDTVDGQDAGEVHVYVNGGFGWVGTILTPLDATANQRFGSAVAAYDGVIVVGARGDASETGAAYVFRHDGVDWIQEAKLVPDDAVPGDRCGERKGVAVSKDCIVVGSPYAHAPESNSGAAYVFKYDGSSWTQTAELNPQTLNIDDRFGRAVAMWEDQAIIASPYGPPDVSGYGTAYHYDVDCCPADFNQDDNLNTLDVIDFLNAFNAGCP